MSADEELDSQHRSVLDAMTSAPADASIERVMVEVGIAGRSEVVTIGPRDGQLLVVSSDGEGEGPHARAALRWLAGSLEDAPAERRTHPGSLAAPRASSRPEGEYALGIAEALDDLLTAVVRLGLDAASGSPSVQEGVERLVRVAPKPMPIGLERWVGRFHSALSWRDVHLLSRLLDGASRVVAHLRDAKRSADAERRVAAWLGSGPETHEGRQLLVRSFVELGREWLPGLERAAIERRYLVDTESGDVFAEERRRGEPTSVGPSPRHLHVGLGEVESESAPPRLRLFQYTVAPVVPEEAWRSVGEAALTDFRLVAEEYRSSLKAFPALAEPFALVRPSRCEGEGALTPVDAEGHPLPLARSFDPPGVAAFERLAAGREVSWIAGRLVDAEGVLLILPFGVGLIDEGRTRYERLR